VEERPESGSGLATRSEGDVSLGGELDGGVAIGAAPPNEGLAVSSAGARGAEGTAIGGGADRTGGADCAWAGSGDTTRAALRTIGQSFTARSPALIVGPTSSAIGGEQNAVFTALS